MNYQGIGYTLLLQYTPQDALGDTAEPLLQVHKATQDWLANSLTTL